jgi:Protein of unknown function (DUF3102)
MTTIKAETTSLTVTAPRKDLVEAANHHHAEAVAHGLKALDHAIQAGEALVQLKAEVKHGEWLEALRGAGLQFSGRTARVYIRLFEHRGMLKDRVGEMLSIRQADRHITDFDFFKSKLPKPGERIVATTDDGLRIYYLGSRKYAPTIYEAFINEEADKCSVVDSWWYWKKDYTPQMFRDFLEFFEHRRPQEFDWQEPVEAQFEEKAEIWSRPSESNSRCVRVEDILGIPHNPEWDPEPCPVPGDDDFEPPVIVMAGPLTPALMAQVKASFDGGPPLEQHPGFPVYDYV